MTKISKEDQLWMAEGDARTLAEAETIKGDNPRLSRARKAAKKIAKEDEIKAAAMKKVSEKRIG